MLFNYMECLGRWAVGSFPTPVLLAIVTILLLAATGGQKTLAGTIVVTSTADDGPGSLRQALVLASDGDTINIVARGKITLTSGELVVGKNLTIRGPGAANDGISGNGISRVFHIMPGTTVTLYSLKITNGRATGAFPANAGGGIFNDHAVLTVDRCDISGNSARYGAGIFSNSRGGGSAALTVNNSTVSGNSAPFGFGGGIFSGGGFFGAGDSGDATLTVRDSRVSNNSAGFGGGLFNDGFFGNATAFITNSSVDGNLAVFNGLVTGGGGIYNNGDSGVASLTLTNSTVSHNVTGTFVEDPTEENPFEPGNGGGIYNDGMASLRPGNAQVTLENTTVRGNTAFGDFPGSLGGGIYNVGGDLGRATVTANNSSFNENRADDGGGGLYNIEFSGEARISLTGGSVNGNVSRSTGGIVNVRFTSELNPDTPGNARLTLANTAVRLNSGFEAIGNSGATLELVGCDVSDNLGRGIVTFAGALPAVATISDSVINRNRSSGEGGGILNYVNGGAFSTVSITQSIIRENYALRGGGIANFAPSGSATLSVNKSTVADNRAVTGGGLLNDGTSATATITNSTLSGNSTQGQLPPGGFLDGGGGGVLNGNGATVSLMNCTLSGNSTHRTGGGIGNSAEGRVTLNNCTLSGNSAGEGGNNIWNKQESEEPPPPEPTPTPCPSCPPPPPPCPPNCPTQSVARVDFANTIFNNLASGENIRNLSGTILSRGYNLSSDAAGGDGSFGPGGFLNAIGDIRNRNPLLGTLGDYGGPTFTHSLLVNSPAINAGDPSFDPYSFTPPLLFDQRNLPGFPRIVNGRIDIGAFESRHY